MLVSEGEQRVQASLSAMTCVHGSLELYTVKSGALGPDPLREDAGDACCGYLPLQSSSVSLSYGILAFLEHADKERLWTAMQRCKKSIGAVLMVGVMLKCEKHC